MISIQYRITPRLALSSYHFALEMGGLTKHVQNDIPWYMLFVYDIVLIDETKYKVNDK